MTGIDTLTLAARRQLSRFCADQSGATAIEYAVIASGIGAVLAAIVFVLGGSVKTLFALVGAAFP